MSNNPVTIRPTKLDPGIKELLEEYDRPTSDIREEKTLFYEAVRKEEQVGVVALQLENNAGLLRSLAVKETARGTGYGTRLVERVVNEAREQNLHGLYLLTTGAAPFFKQLGFEKISRNELPASIQSTQQVQTLCPGSAACLYLKFNDET